MRGTGNPARMPEDHEEEDIKSAVAAKEGPSTQLERGKACLRCRRRKMRCDGQRPTCGQCTRAGLIDCEYTDQGPTASQILEQNVSQLEARIRELEGGGGVVVLHDPHASSSSQNYAGTGATPAIPRNQRVLNAFLTYGPDFGFFLNVPRFLDKLRASIPSTPQSPLPAALIHAVYLIGIIFCDDEQLKREEAQILNRLQQSLSTELDPTRILYALQAEVLLAQYLLHKNSRVAGGYHVGAAVSIAVSCKLHKIRSASWALTPLSSPTVPEVQLFPPLDDVEEGERIRAFWTVFALDRFWSMTMHSPSVLLEQRSSLIDTPWPLEMAEYEQHSVMPQGHTSARTVQQFVGGHITELPNQSLLALRAKACILFEKSVQLADQWNPNSAEFQNQFMQVDARINQVTAVVPGLEGIDGDPNRIQDLRQLILIHSILNAASLQLHSRYGNMGDIEKNKSSAAAVAAANIIQSIDVSRLGHVDPIMGVIWAMIGQTLVSALVALKRNATGVLSHTVAIPAGEIIVTASLNSIINAMDTLRGRCPLIGEESDKLRASVLENQAGVMH